VPISARRPIKVIFHPSDFSEGSEVAFAHALKLALIARAELDILHVSEKDHGAWTEFPGVRQMLERWKVLPPNSPKNAVAATGISVRKVVMKGKDPVHAAQHFLEENPTDFVVLAAHTHNGRMRWGRGKLISQPIASASEAAALFVPYGSDGFVSRADGKPSLRNVLIPVDTSPNPAPAVEAAMRLTWALQCPAITFTLLHVGKAGEMPRIQTEEQEGWTWNKLTRDGEVVEAILSAAKEVGADLIVMTTAGRDGFLDGLRGSTTERVLRGGMIPVLAIPAAMATRGGAVVL
jgi:nucleotide-binding universal stress UspA family protein